MKLAASLVLAALLGLGAGSPVRSQPPAPQDGTVRGRVFDTGGSLIMASVIIIEGRNFKREEGYTEDGNYRVDLPPGLYYFTLKSDGFRTLRRRRVRVRPNSTVKLDFTLRRSKARAARR